MATLEAVLNQAFQLSTLDKVRLIEKVTLRIEQALVGAQAKPGRSLWGVCRDLGPAPSAEEIDQARRDQWSGFPRDDIA